MLSPFLVKPYRGVTPASLVWCCTWQNKYRVSWAWIEALGVSVSQDRGLRCECVPAVFTVLLSVAVESAKSGAQVRSIEFTH